MEVATGKVHGKVTEEKKRTNFQSFMDGIVDEYSPDQEIHVVLDKLLVPTKRTKNGL